MYESKNVLYYKATTQNVISLKTLFSDVFLCLFNVGGNFYPKMLCSETIWSKIVSESEEKKPRPFIQGDQLYMSVCIWYLVKRDLSSVRIVYTVRSKHYSVTFYKVPEQHSHVYLVGLYLLFRMDFFLLWFS